ncbi:MAG TPA: tol-pal system protein YbgF [Thermoanaerobaculia bacterium]|nr:tol-pal system protein YbgF [Thermoanaerobaculia bacterium]
MKKATAVVAICLLSVGWSGCASNPFRRGGEQQTDDAAALKARLVEAERQLRVQEIELGRLRDRVAVLEGSGRQRPGAPASATATPPPAPPSGLDDGVRGSGPADDVEQRDLATPVAAVVAPSVEAQQAYDRGLQLYQAGQYAESEESFRRFLARWAETELADNAAYWIGESRWARQDWKGALAAFQEAVERQPDGNKVPDALLKAGKCLEKLGDPVGARDLYDEVVRRFPGTAAAAAAEERRTPSP